MSGKIMTPMIAFILMQLIYFLQVNGLIGVQNYLQMFTKSFKDRTMLSRYAFEENLKIALEGRIGFKKLKLQRILDKRLPYLVDNSIGPQNHSSAKNTEIDRRFLKYFVQTGRGNSSISSTLALARKYKKLQDELPEAVPFPCDLIYARSNTTPTSVDQLRPGDIDVIGAMGDSLISGFGLIGFNTYVLLMNNEGMSFATGGAKNWRRVFSVANILKEFNSKLRGYGRHDTIYAVGYDSRTLNVAVPASIVDDMPNMARRFIEKAKEDPDIDFEKAWKLIVIQGGSVDMCFDICFWKNMEDAPAYYYRMMEEALDMLMENSPRTLVYFMISPNTVQFVAQLSNKGSFCEFISKVQCACAFGEPFRHSREQYIKLLDAVIQAQISLVKQTKYQSKPDFTVVPINMFRNASYPQRKTRRGDKVADFRYISADCFHLSQRGTAAVANALWNSMLTPVGSEDKTIDWSTYKEIRCPSQQRPYLMTIRNSRL